MSLPAMLKVVEECNELSGELSLKLHTILRTIEKTNDLSQIIAKQAFHLNEDFHKSGIHYTVLIEREAADCLASIDCLIELLNLDSSFITERRIEKLKYYLKTKKEVANG